MSAVNVGGIHALVGAVTRRYHYVEHVVAYVYVDDTGRYLVCTRLIVIYPVHGIRTDRDMLRKRERLRGVGDTDTCVATAYGHVAGYYLRSRHIGRRNPFRI